MKRDPFDTWALAELDAVESALDACETTANVLGNIVVKNA